MTDSDMDEDVATLPEQTLRRIDEAFDRVVAESQPERDLRRPRKRRRIEQETATQPGPDLAGGFLLPDDDGDPGSRNADAGGGFLLEDENDDDGEEDIDLSQPIQIPLSLIPRALQLLDLDPSDEQVLSVFANAASSWSGGRNKRKPRTLSKLSDDEIEREEPEQFVTRRDWRVVCAALMPTSTTAVASPLSSLISIEEDKGSNARAVSEESESGSSAICSEELDDDDSSDEYIPDTKGKGKGRTGQTQTKKSLSSSKTESKTQTKKARKKNSEDLTDASDASEEAGTNPKHLTARQEKDTLAAFALFFPNKPKGTRSDLSEEELSKKRLTIRDVANAASSIKEKITAEEIIEMLTLFSPSSNQSNPTMSFQEFQQMMIAARLA